MTDPATGPIRIGCAGWNIPRHFAAAFPAAGTHLQRYGERFNAVEINSSFYRPHRAATYRRWAAAVPEDFAFAVKAPRAITHERRLRDAEAALAMFLEQTDELGDRRGPLLFQLPPGLVFDARAASGFFDMLRTRFAGLVVCEPRHASWFTAAADRLLAERSIGRVIADPPPVPQAAEPGGWAGAAYVRLHGAPRIYYSSYDEAALTHLARRLADIAAHGIAGWCIFDNTALGAATGNALGLQDLLGTSRCSSAHAPGAHRRPSQASTVRNSETATDTSSIDPSGM